MYPQYVCSTQSRSENVAVWITHKAKIQLLHERIKARVEQQYSKELDALADALVAHAKEQTSENSATEEKMDRLHEQFDKLFG